MAGLTQTEKLMRVGIQTEPAKHFAAMTGAYPTVSGTFVMNGVTPVAVAIANIVAGDAIVFTLQTVGGTVGAYPSVKTITPGTGFTVAGTASDTSTYAWRVMKG